MSLAAFTACMHMHSTQSIATGPLTVCSSDVLDILDTKLLLQGRCNSDPSQQSATVLITDSCPECGADHIDMQALTFQKVSNILIDCTC